ncbi:mismatch-specific DNA-glycosylase [Rhodanobacter sp. MP1X3]|uniref:mismatch-specific DNA-glycosylase n=1 Tax=Rhodanobacter sp. MP1X3 TaxID=2723086 RepID=UPI0018364649|nr:mismatch-specific DNA-glycosylase [Rhodanobacter sp. MP1X3]MBB6241806.1 TDG/mug DNA glycosylase family protein [Rhodanobacter sp. MP1X3]
MQNSMHADDDHVLPDVLQAGLTLVFCGTAAGRRSAAEGAYYAHPGNLFWRALHQSELTPRLLVPAEFSQLPNYGIGLTDLAKHHIGNDNQLPRDAFDAAALVAKIEYYAPRLLAFTSKNGARAALGHAVDYGLQPGTIGETQIFVLPSPSGQARGHWNIAPWLALAKLLHQPVPAQAIV